MTTGRINQVTSMFTHPAAMRRGVAGRVHGGTFERREHGAVRGMPGPMLALAKAGGTTGTPSIFLI